MILMLIDKRFDIKPKSLQKTDTLLKKLWGLNPLEKLKDIKNKNFARFELYAYFMYFPMIITLWLIAFNTVLSYMSILLVVMVSYYFFAGINSYFYKYGFENESLPKTTAL